MKRILSIFSIAVVMISCHAGAVADKENNKDKGGSKLMKRGGNNMIEFKVNKQPVKTSGWTISRFTHSEDPSHEWLNITSNMKEEKRTINVNLNGTRPGKYNLDESGTFNKESHGSYFPDYMSDRSNDFSFTAGCFTITEIDTVKRIVNCTFSGTVRNKNGETLEITDGQIINGSLNPGVRWY